MLTLIILIVMLGILIFVHEFGHFIVAKKTGVYVEEFALGMGPKILKWKRKKDPRRQPGIRHMETVKHEAGSHEEHALILYHNL